MPENNAGTGFQGPENRADQREPGGVGDARNAAERSAKQWVTQMRAELRTGNNKGACAPSACAERSGATGSSAKRPQGGAPFVMTSGRTSPGNFAGGKSWEAAMPARG